MKKVDFEEQPEDGDAGTTAAASAKAPEPKTS